MLPHCSLASYAWLQNPVHACTRALVLQSHMHKRAAQSNGCMLMPLLVCSSLARGPRAKVNWKALSALCIIRLAVLPALGIAIVMGLKAAGVFEPPDRVFMLVLLISHCMPSALNVYAMAAVNGTYHDEVATMLFWQYMVAVVSIPACVTVILTLI